MCAGRRGAGEDRTPLLADLDSAIAGTLGRGHHHDPAGGGVRLGRRRSGDSGGVNPQSVQDFLRGSSSLASEPETTESLSDSAENPTMLHATINRPRSKSMQTCLGEKRRFFSFFCWQKAKAAKRPPRLICFQDLIFITFYSYAPSIAGSRKPAKPQYSMIKIFAGSGIRTRQSARGADADSSILDFHIASSISILDSLSS